MLYCIVAQIQHLQHVHQARQLDSVLLRDRDHMTCRISEQVDVVTTHLELLKPMDAVLNVLNAVPTKTQLLKCWQCLFNALDLSTAVADHQ